MSDYITSRQQSLASIRYFPPNKLATNLYRTSLQLFRHLVGDAAHYPATMFAQRLRTQAQKYSLWGDNSDTRQAGLDERLADADRLKKAVLPLLSSMGGTLIAVASRLDKEKTFADLCAELQQLVRNSEVTINAIPDECDNETESPGASGMSFPAISIDDLDSVDSDGSVTDEPAELEELIQDIQSYNACLYGLGSVLQNSAERAAGFSSLSSRINEPMTFALPDGVQLSKSDVPALVEQNKRRQLPSLPPRFEKRLSRPQLGSEAENDVETVAKTKSLWISRDKDETKEERESGSVHDNFSRRINRGIRIHSVVEEFERPGGISIRDPPPPFCPHPYGPPHP